MKAIQVIILSNCTYGLFNMPANPLFLTAQKPKGFRKD